jgi:hypothetical protein
MSPLPKGSGLLSTIVTELHTITVGHTWLIKEGSRVSPNALAPAIFIYKIGGV